MKAHTKASLSLLALAIVVGGILGNNYVRDQFFRIRAAEVDVDEKNRHEITSSMQAKHVLRNSSSSRDEGRIQLSVSDQARLEELSHLDVTIVRIPELLQFLRSLPDIEQKKQHIVSLLQKWAQSEANEAVVWVGSLPSGTDRQEYLNLVAAVWANRDLETAMRWAKKLEEGNEKIEVLRGIAYEAARTEPIIALEIATDLPRSSENDTLIQHAALQWADKDPEETAIWASKIEEASLRDKILSQVATVWSDTDPISAARLALEKIAPGRAQDDAITGIIQHWVQKDTAAAIDWVNSFPKGELQNIAIETINRLKR